MGTNFYLKREICPTCKHSKERYHIGKSSGGWTFTFRGYRNEWDDLRVENASDWKRETKDGIIVDEYGEEHDYYKFWKMVLEKSDAKHNHAKEYPSPNDWLDAEGNSFSSSEFS